jgi:hypothetical protein
MHSNDFYMVLPSNSKNEEFPNNKTNHFFINFPTHIEMSSKYSYECALVEINYPNSFYNVEKSFGNIFFKRDDVQTAEYSLKEGFFTARDLLAMINERIPKIPSSRSILSYNENNNIFTFEIGRGEKIKIPPQLAELLGFADKNVFQLKSTSSFDVREFRADIPFGIKPTIESLYIYSNLCRESYVGGVYVPLLRQVAHDSRDFGNIITKHFNPAFYIPMQTHNINHIEIKICDNTGQPLRFNFGKVVLTLHIRRKKILI